MPSGLRNFQTQVKSAVQNSPYWIPGKKSCKNTSLGATDHAWTTKITALCEVSSCVNSSVFVFLAPARIIFSIFWDEKQEISLVWPKHRQYRATSKKGCHVTGPTPIFKTVFRCQVHLRCILDVGIIRKSKLRCLNFSSDHFKIPVRIKTII